MGAKKQKVVRQVAGYELLARLGEGGSGTVFKARQPGLDRLVALKILSPQLAKEREYVQRFHLEAKAAARVNHPNIVQVLAAGYDDKIKVPYIVYEFVDGKTLTGLVEDRGSLPEREALAVTRAIGDALGALAELGLVHRDVKPDNILITRTGIPKLTDLGLAKQESDWDTLTQTGIVMGTPDYMAPEQAMGKKDLDLSTDLYALGLATYVMLTAQLPYQGETLVEILTQHIQKDCPDPRALNPNVSEGCAQLVRDMTRRDQKLRYGHSDRLLRDIDLVLAGKRPMGALVAKVSPKAKKSTGHLKRRRMNKSGRPDRMSVSSSDALSTTSARRSSDATLLTSAEQNALGSSRESSVRRPVRRKSFTMYYVAAFLGGAILAFVIFVLPKI